MKVVSVVGARPQFIKAAPMSLALRRSGVDEVLLHTGQHFDANMSDVFFRDLTLPTPKYNLEINNAPHGNMTGRMLAAIEEVILKERPDWVLVFGDTNSTLAGALAAAKLNVSLAHVEAGLRSFNRRMPEEINRIVADHVSTLLLAPTTTAVENLRNEGFRNRIKNGLWIGESFDQLSLCAGSPIVANVGDIMYDALKMFLAKAKKRIKVLDRLTVTAGEYVLVTLHRAENADDSAFLQMIGSELCDLAVDRTVVFPVHPRTRAALSQAGVFEKLKNHNRVILLDPCSYLDFLVLESSASAVITDSGGIQKEAFILKVPCFTLRDETEWVETVESGRNVLLGTTEVSLRESIRNFNLPKDEPASCFGAGNTADISAFLLASIGRTV